MADKRLQRTREAYGNWQTVYTHDYRCALPFGPCSCGADERNGVRTKPLNSVLTPAFDVTEAFKHDEIYEHYITPVVNG